MTLNETSKQSSEKLVYSNHQDKRQKSKSRFQLGQIVRTADILKVFSQGDSTNWSFRFYTITEVNHDTITSYSIKVLPEKYIKSLSKRTQVCLDKNSQVMKRLNLIQ